MLVKPVRPVELAKLAEPTIAEISEDLFSVINSGPLVEKLIGQL